MMARERHVLEPAGALFGVERAVLITALITALLI